MNYRIFEYLQNNIPYTVSFGQDLDFETVDEFVKVSAKSVKHDEGVAQNYVSYNLYIEGYTKRNNPYRHYEMAKTILSILKHKILLSDNSVVEIEQPVDVEYLELWENIKKFIITFSVKEVL